MNTEHSLFLFSLCGVEINLFSLYASLDVSIICSFVILKMRAASILDFLVFIFFLVLLTGMFSTELAEHSGAFRGS